MIILTSDKFILIKVVFPIRDLVHQGLGRSTPWQMARPGVFAPPGNAIQICTDLYNVIVWDVACQRALYPCLSATVHMPV
jgi:hypothetical protein